MVGGDDQYIVRRHHVQKLRQSRIEVLERRRIPGHIAAVPVEHVEVDEVREYDRSIRRFLQRVQRCIEQGGVAARFDFFRNSMMCIYVGDLANADDFTTGFDELVQHGRLVWWRCQVTAVTGANIGLRTVADKWPRDYASDVVVIDKLTGYVAKVVQPLQPERFFVGRNLEHTVGGRVNDRLTALHMLVTELGDDRRAR